MRGQLAAFEAGVRALQDIYNIFRQKPQEALFPQAHKQGVGLLVRLPLASGLLTGKMSRSTVFAPDDHRRFNENGESFNVGETFAGLGLEKGAELAEQLHWIAADRINMTRAALRWILDNPHITCVLPGFRNVNQVMDNLGALDVPAMPY